ncbi:MAG: Trk system potassium transporter TrkA [Muribaculaceae bacterium]|nr:Trk system potassium transporter TrkA [Muribaculaceae bacterium]
MKIIIAGAGEVGTHLAKMLSNEDQDIILIDSDQRRLDIIDANYNLMTWNGSASSLETMRDMGISDTDLYIAVTPYETRNITACSIAKKLGAKKTVARIDNAEFLDDDNRKVLKEIGADTLIYPEHLAALEIDVSLRHNWARYWGELHNGQLLLIGVRLTQDNDLEGKQIKDIPGTAEFNIVAIKRNNETIIPRGNDFIEPGDMLYFVTTPQFIENVRTLCGKRKRSMKRLLIIGGSAIAERFATVYHDKYHIKIIDEDRDKCEHLATMLPDCEIVCGDGLDVDVLRENNTSQYDAFMALTDSSEANILACMTAKEFTVPKTVANVENLQFISQAENLNIGTIINKKLLASSYIFQLLLDADEENAKCLSLSDADAAELLVKKNARITREPVRKLRLPSEMTLAALVRDGRCYLVNGSTQIQEGDYVVVFCLHGFIHKIEKWFY